MDLARRSGGGGAATGEGGGDGAGKYAECVVEDEGGEG